MAATKSVSTVDATKAMLDQIDDLKTEPFTDDELRRAKDELLNSFVFRYDTPEKVLTRAGEPGVLRLSGGLSGEVSRGHRKGNTRGSGARGEEVCRPLEAGGAGGGECAADRDRHAGAAGQAALRSGAGASD